jgi:site-specific DNA-methyltransferase (adenine-specific)
MNRRKQAFINGLAPLRSRKTDRSLKRLTRKRGNICAIAPSLYNAAGMPDSNQIIQGDCIELLNKGREGWVDLVFADPPFNIGYLYHGYNDQRNAADYISFSRDWMSAVYRALKDTGSFYLAIGDEFAAELCVEAKKIGFHMRNWIIWHYTFGQQPKNKYARSHTHILYFTKSEKIFTFNPDVVRVASARQTTYGDKRANPKGKLPDDVWYLRPQEAAAADQKFFATEGDTWNVSRVCGTFKEREGWHGCQMPMGVLNRVISASSNPGDVVLDPFNGSGTTVVAAALLGRKYVGIDQSAEYVGYAKKRLEHALDVAAKEKDAPSATIHLSAIADAKRASKIMTGTDAFGRPRVARRRAKKSA